MNEMKDARDFMRRRIGSDWEVRLMQADALPRRRVTQKETDAAEQRAVELASETCQDWSIDLRDGVSEAWRVLSAHSR
jgi:hypothetical protein